MLHTVLPTEIISNIFVECLPVEDSHRLFPTEAPMLVSAICRHWRQIALAEHRLWDTVVMPADAHNPTRWDLPLDSGGVERWFDRTGSVRLLTLGEEPYLRPPGGGPSQYTGRLRRLVAKYGTSRFRRLYLVLGDVGCVGDINRAFELDPSNNQFSELESMTLSLRYANRDNEARVPHPSNSLSTFATLPKLTHIRICANEPSRTTLSRLLQPWHQSLRSLELGFVWDRKNGEYPGIHFDVWMALFRLCQSLVTASLPMPMGAQYWINNTRLPPSIRSHLTYPTLTSLTLTVDFDIHYVKWEPVTSMLTFPNLRLLHLHFDFKDYSEDKQRYFKGGVVRCIETFADRVEDLILSVSTANVYAPLDVIEVIDHLVKKPETFPRLKVFEFPYRYSKIAKDIRALLRKRPCLKVIVIPLRINGADDVYDKKLEKWVRLKLKEYLTASRDSDDEEDGGSDESYDGH